MKLLVKIPTRSTRGWEWLRGYIDKALSPDTRILLSLDMGQPGPPVWATQSGRLIVEYGVSKNKVHAYNRDIDNHIDDFDIILGASDDMFVQEVGYDEIICNDMRRMFPDTDGCLWYDTEDSIDEVKKRTRNQYIRPGDATFLNTWICMLPIMGKAYYKRFGYVYNEEYTSFWCDNEQTKIALRDNKIRYIHRRIIKHEHPDWGGFMSRDQLYITVMPDMGPDHMTFLNRKKHGFPA